MANELPPLPYKYDSLEPFIDEKTMKIHHDKHHASYILKLNQTLKNYPELQDKPIESLIQGLEDVSEEIRESVKNNGGGHLNHTFFWSILTKKLIFKGEIFNEIDKKFQRRIHKICNECFWKRLDMVSLRRQPVKNIKHFRT